MPTITIETVRAKYIENKGSLAREREIFRNSETLTLREVFETLRFNALLRGRGASSKTYYYFKKMELDKALEQSQSVLSIKEFIDDRFLINFLAIQYIELGGSAARAQNIFCSSRTIPVSRDFHSIIKKLYERAITRPKGASAKTLKYLNEIDPILLKTETRNLFEELETSHKKLFFSFFRHYGKITAQGLGDFCAKPPFNYALSYSNRTDNRSAIELR